MPRPMKGSITEHVSTDGHTYRSLRFQVKGRRHRVPLGPVSAEAAETALRQTIADVERGTWQPRTGWRPARAFEPVPTFHEFAEQWSILTEPQLAPKTKVDYRWRLERGTCCRTSQHGGAWTGDRRRPRGAVHGREAGGGPNHSHPGRST